jgi:hypothetical protein
MGDLVFQHPRLVAQQADHLLLAGVGLSRASAWLTAGS